MSRETFLEYLDSIEGKAEFLDGEIYDMSGGTRSHSLISNNIGALLFAKLNGTDCLAYNSDLAIEIPYDGAIVFPDASVVCGESISPPDRPDITTNPILIVEVLSAGSWRYDRGGKLRKYMRIPSLKEYLIVEQVVPQVDVWSRMDDGDWKFNTYQDLDASVLLPSLGIELETRDLYRGILFEME